MNFRISLFLFFAITLMVSACGTRSHIQPGDTIEVAFEKSMNLYENERYRDAASSFEVVISLARGTDIGQDAQYYLAKSYFNNRDYLIAASEFNRYVAFFPRSARNEDAMFLEAYSYYRLSPRYNLDQTDTYNSIEKFQLFLNRHPDSDRAPEAAGHIDEMREKLSKKMYEAAEQYMRLRQYRSAALYFGMTLERFPETDYAELALVNQINAYVIYADNSVAARQAERYQKAVDAYETYMQLFPRGINRTLAERYVDNAHTGLRRSQPAAADGN